MRRWLPWSIGDRSSIEVEKPLDVSRIYVEHGDFVCRCLQRFGIRSADVLDASQEVFVTVHKRLHTFERDASMPAWLYGICRKVAAQHRRRAYLRRELHVDVEDMGIASGRPDPEESLDVARARRELCTILDELDVDKRAVFVMYEIEQMECAAIAEIMGVPVGTVYSRLHTARKAFEAALERWRMRQSRKGHP
jgi:RNA polymerase sigma-70 factor (ECF subfamily)